MRPARHDPDAAVGLEEYLAVAAHPLVRQALERWISESGRSPAHEAAWRAYRRALISWLLGGGRGRAPTAPRLQETTTGPPPEGDDPAGTV